MRFVLTTEMVLMICRTYTELIRLPTFEERFNYVALNGGVGDVTFGGRREWNQRFYRSAEWKRVRDFVIVRDSGCDLAILDRPIYGKVMIHHLNPIGVGTFADDDFESLLNPEFMVCVSFETHNALHYGSSERVCQNDYAPRSPNDTCPWK